MADGQTEWVGTGLSQEDLMYKDECVLLDMDDNVIGHENKYKSHVFDPTQPRGILHRAFSVFLFNSKGELLLQQRAQSKITFPNVWTNTCCSHPLYGFNPTEVDTPADVANGTVYGTKRAAIRKLLHELGIPPEQVPISSFKFLTRLHYWAADVITHGEDAPWGENEIDYILFIQADVDVTPHHDEVQAYKYVTLEELNAMMEPSTGNLWSPWFSIIARRFLPTWWKDLTLTLTSDACVDLTHIHRFDPSPMHMGGAGNAREWLGQGDMVSSVAPADPKYDTSLKQGGYGKIKIHKESLLEQLSHPYEISSALYFKFVSNGLKINAHISNADEQFCDDMLGRVSRSFAAVIRQLPSELEMATTVFYLALRGLDTIEDDMEAFQDRRDFKIERLCKFYIEGLTDSQFSMKGVGRGDEATLLEEFYKVSRVFQSLKSEYRDVISDITKKMGAGMAEFVSKDQRQGCTTIGDYNLYCHYVAGLVGEGLTRLFVASNLERPQILKELELANSMGLFLQKTNIIRDYLEDYVDGRAWWPQEVWHVYAKQTPPSLGEFASPEARDRALHCLNHLITDALTHVPDCLKYLSMIRTPEIYRFCAIPQIMAIATLQKLYNNPDTFTGVVKIRRGLSVRLIFDSETRTGTHDRFAEFAAKILRTVPESDPTSSQTKTVCDVILRRAHTDTHALTRVRVIKSVATVLNFVVPVVLGLCVYELAQKMRGWDGALPRLTQSEDVLLLATATACIVYLLAFSAMAVVDPSTQAPDAKP